MADQYANVDMRDPFELPQIWKSEKERYSLYLVTADFNNRHTGDYYVVAESYDDASKKVINLFEVAKEKSGDIGIIIPYIINVKHVTKQIHSSSVGCATHTDGEGKPETMPFLYNNNCALII